MGRGRKPEAMSGGSVCVHMACKEPRFLSALVAVAFAPAPRGSDFLFLDTGGLRPRLRVCRPPDSQIPFAALTLMRSTNCNLWGYQLKTLTERYLLGR